MRSSASHPAGPYDRLAQETVNRATISGAEGFATIFTAVHSSYLVLFSYICVVITFTFVLFLISFESRFVLLYLSCHYVFFCYFSDIILILLCFVIFVLSLRFLLLCF